MQLFHVLLQHLLHQGGSTPFLHIKNYLILFSALLMKIYFFTWHKADAVSDLKWQRSLSKAVAWHTEVLQMVIIITKKSRFVDTFLSLIYLKLHSW